MGKIDHAIDLLFNNIDGFWDYLQMSMESAKEGLITKHVTLIMIHALEKSVLKVNEKKWCKNNSRYFRGNCVSFPEYQEIFESECYSIKTLINLGNAILERQSASFAIRNLSVTLRDDVNFKSELNKEYIIYLLKEMIPVEEKLLGY